ncbi:MAG: oxidoreductase [Phycisphaeraceae bacterium]|nr:oxidoreductase [Phycisphaeraceae bacterium]
MSLLSQIHIGKQASPRRCMVHGVQGVGKSTFGATARNPIFIQTEDGLGEIDCAKFPLARSFGQVTEALTDLRNDAHDFQTVVIDSLDWLERLIWQEVCTSENVSNIEKIGFQKGYTYALNFWRKFLDALDELRRLRGMTVVLIAHTRIEKFQTPEDSAFDRFSPRLHKLAASVVMEWCDEVFFATYTVTTDPKKIKSMTAPQRVMRTCEGPTHVAKNRLNMPYELPLEWDAYAYYTQQAHPQNDPSTEITTTESDISASN